MTSITDICGSIYGLSRSFSEAVEALGDQCMFLEEVQNLQQFLRRLDALLSTLEPYLIGVRIWSSLREVEGVLVALLQVLTEAAAKGPLVSYLQADHTTARFAAAAGNLDTALGRLEEEAFQCSSSREGSTTPLAACCGAAGSCGCSCCGAAGISHPRLSPTRSSSNSSICNSGRAHEDCNGYRAVGSRGHGAMPEAAREQLRCLRSLLQRTRFGLPAPHAANLLRFRHACDSLHAHFQALQASCGDMLGATLQARQLSQEAFAAAVSELQGEVELQQQLQLLLQADPTLCSTTATHGSGSSSNLACEARTPSCGRAASRPPTPQHSLLPYSQVLLDQVQQSRREQHYLRMLMDVIRAAHVDTECEAPLEYLCPLTHQLMQDPVVLHDTGHSYERKALEEWWAKGHHFCPRTGVSLRRLSITPNHNLRSAIERWRLHGDMHLTFRPVLNTLAAEARKEHGNLPPPQQQREEEEQEEGAPAHACFQPEEQIPSPSGQNLEASLDDWRQAQERLPVDKIGKVTADCEGTGRSSPGVETPRRSNSSQLEGAVALLGIRAGSRGEDEEVASVGARAQICKTGAWAGLDGAVEDRAEAASVIGSVASGGNMGSAKGHALQGRAGMSLGREKTPLSVLAQGDR